MPDNLCQEVQRKWAKIIKQRPDAIVIKMIGDLSYANILHKIKNDLALKDLREKVGRIRDRMEKF